MIFDRDDSCFAKCCRVLESEQYQPTHNREEAAKVAVEEKFGEQNFRVLSEIRGKILYCNPKKLKNFKF